MISCSEHVQDKNPFSGWLLNSFYNTWRWRKNERYLIFDVMFEHSQMMNQLVNQLLNHYSFGLLKFYLNS